MPRKMQLTLIPHQQDGDKTTFELNDTEMRRLVVWRSSTASEADVQELADALEETGRSVIVVSCAPEDSIEVYDVSDASTSETADPTTGATAWDRLLVDDPV